MKEIRRFRKSNKKNVKKARGALTRVMQHLQTFAENIEQDKDVPVQAGGGLTVVRQRTRRSMQQLHLAGFLAKHSCTVAGIGDARLGDDITLFSTAVKDAALAEHERAAEATSRNGGGLLRTTRPRASSARSPRRARTTAAWVTIVPSRC